MKKIMYYYQIWHIFTWDLIYSFKNSTNVFDNEDTIKEALDEYRIMGNRVQFMNYSFVDSKDNQLTQLSDIFIGLMGKYPF